MGQPVKFIVRVIDAEGQTVPDAQVTLTLHDASGQNVATIPAVAGRGQVYRTEAVPVPHHTVEGKWDIAIEAKTAAAQGAGSGSFKIKNSTSEILVNKYGFWLDAPTLRGIVPQLVAERGDAQNGMIRRGGIIPSQHVLPENWIELHWREGDYRLDSPAAVRQFLLKDVGDLGFTPVREIGPFQATRVQAVGCLAGHGAWAVGGHSNGVDGFLCAGSRSNVRAGNHGRAAAGRHRSPCRSARQFRRHARDSRGWRRARAAAHQTVARTRVLLSPPLGALFQGLDQPIVLRWKPLKELAPDEYYEISVDSNYKEANPQFKFTTRDTQFTLPTTLYQEPNCGVFNWQVTLKRQTGTDEDGLPQGEAISYGSLYRYVRWIYPTGTAPFKVLCPNQQV